ncbi:uncharacterized protein LOC129585447 isoform X1 [Paramacrobiotus metropolitanus]|uniref:uncharacterized protein LOC129585447 isoform X1 n=1 Tax=Paramacrobiotus metropolitanus TaxID=2943436 RepID=UPI00244659D9|nr:uncharacterized protein LOC129585447 isoform X1 [Paramacrobiotus metropolitanus]
MANGDVCCVLQCPLSEPSRSMRSVCFFAFPHPSDPRYPVWIERTRRAKDWTPSAASKICSRHFCSTDILSVPSAEDCEKTEKRLKHDALPSLFEGIPRSLQPPVESVPRPDSPEIGSNSLPARVDPPRESRSRPGGSIIGSSNARKRSADDADRLASSLKRKSLPPRRTPTTPAPVAKIIKLAKPNSQNTKPSAEKIPELPVAAVVPPAPAFPFPSPDVLFHPDQTDSAIAPQLCPVLPRPSSMADAVGISSGASPMKSVNQSVSGSQLRSIMPRPPDVPFVTITPSVALFNSQNQLNSDGHLYSVLSRANNFTPAVSISSATSTVIPSVTPVEHQNEHNSGRQLHFIRRGPRKNTPAVRVFPPAPTVTAVDVPNQLESVTEVADPMQICCVPGCPITSWNASRNLATLFPFVSPTQPLQYDIWVTRLRCTTSWEPQPPLFICNQHFDASDVPLSSVSSAPFNRTLNPLAVPSRLTCISAFHYSGMREGAAETNVAGMQTCLACGAKRKPGWTKPSETLVFYPYPTNSHLDTLWMKFLVEKNCRREVTRQSLMCQNHFAADDFVANRRGGELKSDAVPSLMFPLWTDHVPEEHQVAGPPLPSPQTAVAIPTSQPKDNLTVSTESERPVTPAVPFSAGSEIIAVSCVPPTALGATPLLRGKTKASARSKGQRRAEPAAASSAGPEIVLPAPQIAPPSCTVTPRLAVIPKDPLRTSHTTCCVPGCRVWKTSAVGKTVTYHCVITTSALRYSQWLDRIRCAVSWQPWLHDRICSQHFHPEDFDYNGRKHPKATAVPSRLECMQDFRTSLNPEALVDLKSKKICCVCGWWRPLLLDYRCTTRSERLTFFPFPAEVTLRSQWVAACRQWKPEFVVSDGALVCENHFRPEDLFFTRDRNRPKKLWTLLLHNGAIPSRKALPLFSSVRDAEVAVGIRELLTMPQDDGYLCCVPGCRLIPGASSSAEGLSYCAFPTDRKRRNQWINSMRCAVSWQPRERHHKVCSQHFTAQNFICRGGVVTLRLKPGVIPSRMECVEKFRTPGNSGVSDGTVQVCSVCGWYRSTAPCKPSERLVFFNFPTDSALCNAWIAACRKLNRDFVLSDGSLVCENHFTPDDLMVVVPRAGSESIIMLKDTAVPSLKSFDIYPTDNNEDTGLSVQPVGDSIGDSLAPDAGLPFESSDIESEEETEAVNGDSDLPMKESVSLESSSAPVYSTRTSSVTSNQQVVSHNGLPGDEESVAASFAPRAIPPAVVQPRTRTGNAVTAPPSMTSPSNSFLYCESCSKVMQTPCWIHSDSIPDEPVIPLAVGSLPRVLYMDVCDESPTGKTVFVKETLERHTVFGPLVAPTVSSDEDKPRYMDVSELGEDVKRKQYQLDSDYACNWMKHVRLADSEEASNLLVFARGGEIVFVTNRVISPHEELRVWYSRQYLDLVTPAATVDLCFDGETPVAGAEEESGMVSDDCQEEQVSDEEMSDDVPLDKETALTSRSTNTSTMPLKAFEFQENLWEPETNLAENGSFIGASDGRVGLDAACEFPEIPDGAKASLNGLEGSRKCSLCGESFIDVHDLIKHVKGHSRRQKCPVCGIWFAWLEAHLRSFHPEHPIQTDKLCQRAKSRKSSSAKQKPKMSSTQQKFSDYAYRCPECHEQYDSQNGLRNHMKSHQPGYTATTGYTKLTCTECGLRFATQELCRLHQMNHQTHDDSAASQQRACPACPRTFDECRQLAQHVDTHGTPTKLCPVCGKWFGALRQHIYANHPEVTRNRYADGGSDSAEPGTKKFSCPQCGKRFALRISLQAHLKNHKTSLPMNNQTCQECGLRFGTDAGCELHKLKHKLHTGDETPPCETTTCPECHDTFEEVTELLDHVSDHGRPTKQCPVCSKWYSKLRSHIRREHRGVDIQSESSKTDGKEHRKPVLVHSLTCQKCGMTFELEELYRLHKLQHGDAGTADTEESTRQCPQCSKSFTDLKKLLRHVDMGHGTATKQCPHCDGWFDRRQLYDHIKRMHRAASSSDSDGVEEPSDNEYSAIHEEFLCGFCGAIFLTNELLKLHTAGHCTKDGALYSDKEEDEGDSPEASPEVVEAPSITISPERSELPVDKKDVDESDSDSSSSSEESLYIAERYASSDSSASS